MQILRKQKTQLWNFAFNNLECASWFWESLWQIACHCPGTWLGWEGQVIGACRDGQRWSQSVSNPASKHKHRRKEDIPRLQNSLFRTCFFVLDSCWWNSFFSDICIVLSSTGLKDPGSNTWVKVLSSLDYKYSSEPQAIPCSITWRRNTPNTLSPPVSPSHLCACQLAADVLWGESLVLPL